MRNQKKIKILYIHQSGGGGGASNCLGLLVSCLDKDKFIPVVILGKDGPIAELFGKKNIKTYILKVSSFGVYIHSPKISYRKTLSFLYRFLPDIFTIYRIIKNEKVDIVHINSSVLITTMIAARLTGVKIICHIREIIPDDKIGRLQKAFIEFIASNIITISKEVHKQFKEKKTIMIYDGINPEKFIPNLNEEEIRIKYRLTKEETIFTHIGQLYAAKGSYIFLKAAKMLIESNHNVRFFIIGGPVSTTNDSFNKRIKNIIKWFLGYLKYRIRNPKENLEAFAQDLGISKRVIFTGFRNDVQNFIALSDAIVAPHCIPEPFGMVLIEAGALKKPIISTNIPPTPDIVINSKTGLLVEPNSPKALYKAMEYIINNPMEAQKMGENGYRNVVNNFHIDITYSKIKKLYEKILN